LAAGMPSPKGQIEVRYVVRDAMLEAEIDLPPGLRGDFVWLGKVIALDQTKTRFKLPA
jgi:hypothetical protein